MAGIHQRRHVVTMVAMIVLVLHGIGGTHHRLCKTVIMTISVTIFLEELVVVRDQ